MITCSLRFTSCAVCFARQRLLSYNVRQIGWRISRQTATVSSAATRRALCTLPLANQTADQERSRDSQLPSTARRAEDKPNSLERAKAKYPALKLWKKEEESSLLVTLGTYKELERRSEKILTEFYDTTSLSSQERYQISLSCKYLYRCITDGVNYDDFKQAFNLPDTLGDWWCPVTFLHMWMVYAVLRPCGARAAWVVNELNRSLWEWDLPLRVKQLEVTQKDYPAPVKHKKQEDLEMKNRFVLTMLCLDEGFQCDDYILANAIWASLFQYSTTVEPEQLELAVAYIRRQMHYLSNKDPEVILRTGMVDFLPLHVEDRTIDTARNTFDKQTRVWLDLNLGDDPFGRQEKMFKKR